MNRKGWLIILVFYALMALALVVLTYLLARVMLQMPMSWVCIMAGLSLGAFTIGVVGALFVSYIKRRR